MTWSLPAAQHRTFNRNALDVVVVQLRFEPVLKIESFVPDFQEAIRARFPRYEERLVQGLEVLPSGIHLRDGKEFRFLVRGGDATTVILGDQSLAIEYRAHEDRKVLVADYTLAFGALERTARIQPTRLGLRYVNVLDRVTIGEALGRSLDWPDLIDPAFLTVPADLGTLEGTRFAAEWASPMAEGNMTIRYGLLPGAEDRLIFRLDVDRSIEGLEPIDPSPARLEQFSDDIFRVFSRASGAALKEWMER